MIARVVITGILIVLRVGPLVAEAQELSAGTAAGPVSEAAADEEGAAREKPRAWVVLPHAFYTPETGLAGGLVAGHYPGGGLGARPSSTLGSFTLTAHRQLSAELVPDLYLRGGRLRVSGTLRATKYPDVFYGIGNATTPAMEEDYTSRGVEAWLAVQREVARGSWLGVRAQLETLELTEVEADRLLETGNVVGAEGGTALGLGVVVARDTRDRSLAPRSGVYATASWTGFGSWTGSDYDFGLVKLDARAYRPLGVGVVAVRGYSEAVRGEAPFTLLPRLGGARLMRGYRDGRYRDDLVAALEAEYRFPLVWRFGGVVYGGIGDVAGSVGDLPPLAELERALGAGLRFRLTEAGVKVRLDWARGREDGGLYIGLGDAF